MRLKTFTATYLLLLAVLFASLSIVSVYLNNSQTNMLESQSQRDYYRISTTLTRDIAVIYGRTTGLTDLNFHNDVEQLVQDYARYYRRDNIEIYLVNLNEAGQENVLDSEISFVQLEQEHFVRIAGTLPEPFRTYQLIYYLNITESIMEMNRIQRVLLLFFIVFSVVAAFALYFILLRIFKPLDIVAEASRKIANEHYHERIAIAGSSELAKLAEDFNRMAETIENQIRMLEEESDDKQRFVDNFAHEIRTPLTSIYGNAQYMQKTALDEGELINLTQSIMNKTEQITDISNSLLKLATLRNYSPNLTEISIPRLFEDIAQQLSKPVSEHGVQFDYKSNVDILPGQEDLIKILLLNLCTNGLQACSPGSGFVTLEAESQNGYIVISVTDNGAGIPSDSLLKVAEPFYRVDKARSRIQGGTGLGLTICKQIVDVHKGDMTIESRVGFGTVVKIIFANL